MNEAHLRHCASPEWAEHVENVLLPWVLADGELGDDVLEVGPGPGLTTDVLRRRAARLTAVEVDDALATALAGRLAGTNVTVVHGDGTNLPFDADRFTAATLLTMLHHVPSPQLQDRLLAEVCRVLRPGGLILGVDSVDSPRMREHHVDDTLVPIDPAGFPDRLRAAGFTNPEVEESDGRFRFRAAAPA